MRSTRGQNEGWETYGMGWMDMMGSWKGEVGGREEVVQPV